MARYTVGLDPLVETPVVPACFRRTGDEVLFLDFGRAAFGTLLIPLADFDRRDSIVVHLGEKLGTDGRIDRDPPGTIRYQRIEQAVAPSAEAHRVVIPPDPRNTGKGAILMPHSIGDVYPFRYAEIEDAACLDPQHVRQIAVHYAFDDDASLFTSSNAVLNDVWEICKYTIKATSFCGVYVDGDRERIPYEGDAYINQLGHYCVDTRYEFARYSHEYLIQHPTWPTDWILHSVLMAWEDYLYSGDTASLECFYEDLCAKSLVDLARPDGLISTDQGVSEGLRSRLHFDHEKYIFDRALVDLVDWPPGSFTEGGQGERDNHEMRPINTVVNALHYRALVLMSRIAGALGKSDDAGRFCKQAARARESINEKLFDSSGGIYVDGEGSLHSSLHSNMFLLAHGAVPPEHVPGVVEFVKSRGMACSVYGAQHLLDGLYRHGQGKYALELLTATHDRGWRHMLEQGSTMTWEAWDWKYKNNLDWNHAWGAAPANIIPRRLMGVCPATPGWGMVDIKPQPGDLEYARLTHPTPRGAVGLEIEQGTREIRIQADIPEGTKARLSLPGPEGATLSLNGKRSDSRYENGFHSPGEAHEGSLEWVCRW